MSQVDIYPVKLKSILTARWTSGTRRAPRFCTQWTDWTTSLAANLEFTSVQALRVEEKWTASCNYYMLYLLDLSDAVSGAHDEVLEHIVKFSSSLNDFKGVLLARLNHQRGDYLRHAEEQVRFAQLNDPSILLRGKTT